eukprot:464468-Rhodomonas_salina.3
MGFRMCAHQHRCAQCAHNVPPPRKLHLFWARREIPCTRVGIPTRCWYPGSTANVFEFRGVFSNEESVGQKQVRTRVPGVPGVCMRNAVQKFPKPLKTM